MMKTSTKGHELTATLRRYFSAGPRTRRYRQGADLHEQMVEALELNAQYPGYFAPATTEALDGTYGVTLAYRKHVDGYRIDGTLRHRISAMSPWQFAALLGQMVDAGVSNTGEGERFFAAMRQERLAA